MGDKSSDADGRMIGSALGAHLGVGRVAMPDFGYHRTDGTFVTVEVKCQAHPNVGSAADKFQEVASAAKGVVPGKPRESRLAFILTIPDWWSGAFQDPNHRIVGGIIHDLDGPLLIDSLPIEVNIMRLPRP
jgi:hypothetical protein